MDLKFGPFIQQRPALTARAQKGKKKLHCILTLGDRDNQVDGSVLPGLVKMMPNPVLTMSQLHAVPCVSKW